jgi:flagellar motility protein MotE (MotC chaperone)
MLKPLIKTLAGLSLALAYGLAPAQPTAPLSPAELAFVKAETQKANQAFIKKVADALKVPQAQVGRALPDEKRITDRIARLIEALEKDMKRALTEEEKAAIQAADEERKKSIAKARGGAAQK